MKLKVRVEIELVASLDLYLNATGVIITVHWLSGEGGCAGSRQELHLLGEKVKNFTAVAVIFLLDFPEWCKCNTTKLFW